VAGLTPDGDLFLFGGWGYGASSNQGTGFLNDIWEYDHTTGQWTWWKGTSGVNAQTVVAKFRRRALCEQRSCGRRGAAYLASRIRLDILTCSAEKATTTTPGAPPGYLNDLWDYLPFP